MAKFMIHSVDGGYVPPFERVAIASGVTPAVGVGLAEGEGGATVSDTPDYVCMCKEAKNGEVLAVRVTDNIVFDVDGVPTRLK